MGETYYELLGVSPAASRAEIEQAYREKLKESHPDVSDEEDAASRTRRLIRAKETLTDEAERDRYDRLGHERYVAIEGKAGKSGGGEQSSADRAGGSGRQERGATGQTNRGSAGTGFHGMDAGSTDSRGAGFGFSQQRRTSSTARSASVGDATARQADWYQSESAPSEGNQRRNRRQDGGGWNGAGNGQTGDAWRAWNTNASYAVRRDADGRYWGLTGEGPHVLLAVMLVVFPILLFGALFPIFPLAVRFVVGVCLVLIVAFIQSQPEVGIVVFGIWSVLLPITLAISSVPLLSIESLVALIAVLFPLGLSILSRAALRPHAG